MQNNEPQFHLEQQLRLARAWKKGGKAALKAELSKMHPAADEQSPLNQAPADLNP
jgi:hypothetical protein